jgi:predicted small secreted protein
MFVKSSNNIGKCEDVLKKLFVVEQMGGVFMLGGCNTMAGLGKDVEKAGDEIENKARRERSTNGKVY